MRISDLRRHEGKFGVLCFNDGHKVKMRIVHVDLEDRKEVIYDVIDVLTSGPAKWKDITPGTTAAAPLADLTDFQLLDDGTDQ